MFRTNRCSKCFLESELNRSFDRSLINGQKPDYRLKYDCEFIALAQHLDIPLITSDKQILDEFPDTAVSIESYC